MNASDSRRLRNDLRRVVKCLHAINGWWLQGLVEERERLFALVEAHPEWEAGEGTSRYHHHPDPQIDECYGLILSFMFGGNADEVLARARAAIEEWADESFRSRGPSREDEEDPAERMIRHHRERRDREAELQEKLEGIVVSVDDGEPRSVAVLVEEDPARYGCLVSLMPMIEDIRVGWTMSLSGDNTFPFSSLKRIS